MRIQFNILFLFLQAVIVFTGCNDNTTTEPPEQNYPELLSRRELVQLMKYSVTEKDSLGNLVQEGTRNILFSGTAMYNGINYTTQDDSLDFGSQSDFSTI